VQAPRQQRAVPVSSHSSSNANTLLQEDAKSNVEFREQRRRKLSPSADSTPHAKKGRPNLCTGPQGTVTDPGAERPCTAEGQDGARGKRIRYTHRKGWGSTARTI
jgi:hypothetical protein